MDQRRDEPLPTSGLGALRHVDFRRYLAAGFLGGIAVQIQTVAVGWQVYSISHQPLDLGLIGLSQFLPFILLVLPAGQAADRLDRRRILAGCYALLAVGAILLLGFSMGRLTSTAPILGVMTLAGVARAFSMPTGQALLPNLVPSTSFGNAVAISSSSSEIASIAGPAVGGLLFLVGPTVAYGAAAALLGVGSLLLLGVRPPASNRIREPMGLNATFSGLRFVFSRPVVLGSISLDLFAVLLGGATALLPAFASDVLRVGPAGLGLLRSAPAVGALLAAGTVAIWPLRRGVGGWMFGCVAGFGLATVVFGLSSSFPLSMFALAVLGAADMVSVYIRHLLVQLETPDAIRGRVSAVNAVFIGASNELGEFESGISAALFGLVPAVLIGGGGTLLVAAVWARLFPDLRRLHRFPLPATPDKIAPRGESG
ncbi:MAG: MFS transporter [Chloroflexota bacterium]|nr:MFS transporter [Chloroflexota bacterium]